jgi:hypothetical protein
MKVIIELLIKFVYLNCLKYIYFQIEIFDRIQYRIIDYLTGICFLNLNYKSSYILLLS